MSEADISMQTEGVIGATSIPPASEPHASDTVKAASQTGTPSVSLAHQVFSFPMMLATFLVGRVFYEARAFFVDPDLWWHIRVGQDLLATHRWPTTDPFSFTVVGHPWIAYEWLGGVLLAVVMRYGGLLGLEVVLIVVSSAVILALYIYTTLRSGNSKAAFVASGLLCSLAFASFTLRPQMLGYLFLVLVLIAVERFRQGKQRALWFLPLLFLMWVNVHGSFIVGLGVLFVHWAAGLWDFRLGGIETQRWTAAERIRLELVFLLCLAVLPLTPYGTQSAVYPFNMAFAQPINVAHIMEWQPMPFNVAGAKLFLAVVLAFFLAQMLFRPTWRLAEIVLFFGGTVMACLHVRFLLLFVPFFAPLFATLLARWLPPYDRKKDHYILNAVLMAAVIAAMVRYFPTRADMQRLAAKQFPVQAVEYLRQHSVPGPMFNTYGFGGYLVYSGQKVFIDGRADVYERGGVLSDYLHISLIKPAALAVLDGYGVRSCILQRGEPLSVVLAASPEWKRLYFDDVSELFVRR